MTLPKMEGEPYVTGIPCKEARAPKKQKIWKVMIVIKPICQG
jgi:hypothetical protein